MRKTNTLSDHLKQELRQRYSEITTFDVPLSRISRWRIGGTADVIVSPRSVEELAGLRAWIYQQGLPSVVIGATSNLLFSDEGLRAIAIQIGPLLSAVRIKEGTVCAESGAWAPGLARKAMNAGLSGIEHVSGIPATLGGLVFMNGGSQRKGIGERISKVESVDAQGRLVYRNQPECQFTYRHSVYQGLDEVISNVTLELDLSKNKATVRSEMLSILQDRRKKFPQKLPNCGSVFQSTPSMYEEYGPPGKVIELCGGKGISIGGASVSHKHANFIVNSGTSTAQNVLDLIKIIGNIVRNKTGHKMKVEPKHIDSSGRIQEITFD